MKLTKSLLLALLAAVLIPFSAFAGEDEKPIVTFHTNLYEEDGELNTFSVSIGSTHEGEFVDIDCGYGKEELEVGVAYIEGDSTLTGTLFTGKVSPEGVVRIYGDPRRIDYLNCTGCGITDIELDPQLNLQILNLEHNSLKSLNIDSLQTLQIIYLADNPFTPETPLNIGYMPKLVVLEVGQIDYISPDFTLKNYPALYSFDAYHTLSLKKIDPTNCPGLVRLSLDMTSVDGVDVSNCPDLCILNVSDTRVSSLDLSKNPRLQELYCTHASGRLNTDVKLSELDVTNNPKLFYLFCGGNNLRALDLTKNPALIDFSAPNNLLTAINLDNNFELYNVNLNNNYMDFVTLPSDPGTWGTYYYQQCDLQLDDTYKVGDVIDFNSRVTRPGTETNGALYFIPKESPTDYTPVPDSCYTYADGKLTLLQPITTDKVMMVFTNSELSEYPLYTEPFTVVAAEDYGKDVKAIEFASNTPEGNEVKFGIGIVGATIENPVTVKVSFGDGATTAFKVTSEIPSQLNVKGKRTGYANVYVEVPQDKYISALWTEGVGITNINLANLTELRVLKLRNAGLYSIDMSYNSQLEQLDLSGNNLSAVSLEGKTYYYYKGKLADVNLSNNRINSFTFDDLYGVHRLDISNNQLEELDVSDADNLVYCNISGNKFTQVLFNYSEVLDTLIASGNKIASIYVPKEAPLSHCDLSNNNFTIADIPELLSGLSAPNLIYAPQNVLQIATTSPGVDLSKLNVTVGGAATQYVWKKADGSVLTDGVDYTMVDGSAKFLEPVVGVPVYCEMTNAGLPQFEGENAYKTTLVTPIGMPSHELASFTTTEEGGEVELSLAASKEGTSIYFDWNGDGNVTQYTLTTTYTRFSAITHADKKVRVLVASPDDKISIFSITGAKMKDADFSNLKEASAISVCDADLTEFSFPKSESVFELNLSGNKLTSIDFTLFPNLYYVALNGNEFKTIDLSTAKTLGLAYLGNNKIESVKFDNEQLWNLDLGGNNLSSFSFDGIPNIEQLWLTSNHLKTLDVSAALSLRVLNIARNEFMLSTLPLPESHWYSYDYGKQANLDVVMKDGQVDLSTEAVIGGATTSFRWFIGEPVYNDETSEYEGEELVEGEEYTLENGVTTFKFENAIDDLVCMITNETFPNIILFTNPVSYEPVPTAITDVRESKNIVDGKFIRDNRVVIVREGNAYNVTGQKTR